MITNDQLCKVLMYLKEDGISYRYISKISDIPYDTFYYYKRYREFPLDLRIKIEIALREKFGEYIDEYAK